MEARQEAIVRCRSVWDLLEERPRQSCGAREDAFALVAGELLDAWGQELKHHAERELALHHAATSAKGVMPSAWASSAAFSSSDVLPIPGAPSITTDPPRPVQHAAERSAYLLQLGVPLEQVARGVLIAGAAP